MADQVYGIGGSIPQVVRMGESVGIKKLFYSERESALLLGKTAKPGYGVLQAGTVMAVCSATNKMIPYPQTNADDNDTNAKAYLTANPGSAATTCYIGIEDSYKFEVGDSLIMDGSGAGVAEVQSIVCTTPWAENSVYTITHGDDVLTATQGATETLAAIVGLLQAATNYADMPYTIAAGSNALTLTWKVPGAVTELAFLVKDSEDAVEATETTTGVDYQQGELAAEDLGAITAIDREAVNGTQAKITFSTAITNYANFTSTYSGCVYVKGGDDSTPFTKAMYILDQSIDTGTGVLAAGGLGSVVVSNAILYTASLVGMDAAAIVDMSSVTDGRFTILK